MHPATQPGIFSADETADFGIDLGTPVVEAIVQKQTRASADTSRSCPFRCSESVSAVDAEMQNKGVGCTNGGSRTLQGCFRACVQKCLPGSCQL